VKDAVDSFVFERSHVQFSVHRAVTATDIFCGILQTLSENERTATENHQAIVIPLSDAGCLQSKLLKASANKS
jgi:hypothetical protein